MQSTQGNGESTDEIKRQKLWAHLVGTFVDCVAGTFHFLLIASIAVGLDKLVGHLKGMEIDVFIAYGIKWAAYMLFGADLVLFARFLWLSVKEKWGGE